MQLQDGGGEREQASSSATLWSPEDSQFREKGVFTPVTGSKHMNGCGASISNKETRETMEKMMGMQELGKIILSVSHSGY